MKIHENIKNQGKSVSFEFFPPKDPSGENRLLPVIKRLEFLGRFNAPGVLCPGGLPDLQRGQGRYCFRQLALD
jgi:5,10-methylenetetrahydrofolate reductase